MEYIWGCNLLSNLLQTSWHIPGVRTKQLELEQRAFRMNKANFWEKKTPLFRTLAVCSRRSKSSSGSDMLSSKEWRKMLTGTVLEESLHTHLHNWQTKTLAEHVVFHVVCSIRTNSIHIPRKQMKKWNLKSANRNLFAQPRHFSHFFYPKFKFNTKILGTKTQGQKKKCAKRESGNNFTDCLTMHRC